MNAITSSISSGFTQSKKLADGIAFLFIDVSITLGTIKDVTTFLHPPCFSLQLSATFL
jgi:hypothetical protein